MATTPVPHEIGGVSSSDEDAMIQSNLVEKAGALAQLICRQAGGKVSKVFFCSSGSEGIEAVIEFARAHIGRTDLIYAAGAFHGLTCGVLSLMGSAFWRESFGPMLGGTHEVPFGDLLSIEKLLATRKIAAVTVHSSKVFWIDALNLGRRAMSL
jgi:ornithine--oxo-acid transaminase